MGAQSIKDDQRYSELVYQVITSKTILAEICSFCHYKELLLFSYVSKNFSEAVLRNDNTFKLILNEKFASDFEEYSLDRKIDKDTIMFCCVMTNNYHKNFSSEFMTPYSYTWKNLFSIGNHIQFCWDNNTFSYLIKNQLSLFKEQLFMNLKSCYSPSRLRKRNYIIENEINSNFQLILSDFLLDQQRLFDSYEEEVKKGTLLIPNMYNCNIYGMGVDFLFFDFIQNYPLYLNKLKLNIEEFGKLRWYIWNEKEEKQSNFLHQSFIFSSNVKPKEQEENFVLLTHKLINQMLLQENNEILYVLKCLNLTVTFFSQFMMNYIYQTYKNMQYEFIKEFNKRYENFVSCACEINEQCGNLNIAINNFYNDLYHNNFPYPKFSVFRLMMKTWFREMNNKIDKNETIFSFLISTLSSIYSKFIIQDFKCIQADWEHRAFIKKSYEDKCNLSISTSLSTRASNVSENNNQYSNSYIVKPFGSRYEDDLVHYSLIEKGMIVIYDSFCNEFNIDYLNHTDVPKGKDYENLEERFLDTIKTQLISLINKLIIERKISPKGVTERILKYFNSNFYVSRILNTLKYRIYKLVNYTFEWILFPKIKNEINHFISFYKGKILLDSFHILEPKASVMDQDLIKKIVKKFEEPNSNVQILEKFIRKYYFDNIKKDTFLAALKIVKKWFSQEQKYLKQRDKEIQRENEKDHLYLKDLTHDTFYQPLRDINGNATWKQILEIIKDTNEKEKVDKGY